ncbi:MAG: BMC domain-containing protein [Clostridia bacterium]|nr:BMC domain-containing protein [Clostridia bacterium]
MSKAIGMVECQTIATGMQAADMMLKTAEVEIIESQPVCPGKYIILISGDLSAVKASVDAATTAFAQKVIGSFVLGNPHESVFPAIYGASEVIDAKALGVMETFNSAAAIVAADAAAKTSLVSLVELRLARGMCGKSYLLLTGDVAAVSAAIERAEQVAEADGMMLDSAVIPNPDKKLWSSIL